MCAAQDLPDGVPEMIHLIPAGAIATVDGRGPYQLASAAMLAQAFKTGDRLPIDENHATDLAAPQGLSAPARGWIVGLEARADGLWGRVDWTESGKALLADKAYRHISPVITHTATGDITGLLRASLTNRPNFRGLTALNQEIVMDTAALAVALGLPATASIAEINAEGAKLRGQVSAHQAEMDKIAAAVGLAAGADAGAVLQAAAAVRDPNRYVPAPQVAELQRQLTSLQAELTATTNAGKRKAAEVAIDAAIAEGRVGIKPLRDHYISRHMVDAAGVEKEIAAMAVISGTVVPGGAPKNPGGKTAREIADAASRHMAEAHSKGITLSQDEAIRAVTGA